MEKRGRHRLNQKDLVKNIFTLFTSAYENNDDKNIRDTRVPLDHVIAHLQKQCDVSYKSDQWIWTQLKRYEEEIGVQLFRKVRGSLAIATPFVEFGQKKHLFLNEKIRVANGLYDMIQDLARSRGGGSPITIFLGAGTLCYSLSLILTSREDLLDITYRIHTNNLGVIQQLTSSGVSLRKIEIIIPQGAVDPVTHTINGRDNDFYEDVHFDFIIQGTSQIYENKLFIESQEEGARKETLLHRGRGCKVLALTRHEFSLLPPSYKTKSYGVLKNYDFLIVPKKKNLPISDKPHDLIFENLKKELNPEILNWNYEIYKTNLDRT